ncbi:hypothetical protein MKEN_01141100 [Mycena kentingensis (nom. inval.)]|nr:hypothetical protein MKEN_01141100 [Mycena kentingensis (nom. inval.)]
MAGARSFGFHDGAYAFTADVQVRFDGGGDQAESTDSVNVLLSFKPRRGDVPTEDFRKIVSSMADKIVGLDVFRKYICWIPTAIAADDILSLGVLEPENVVVVLAEYKASELT